MKLHVDIVGSGADLVLLHGWGLNSSIWDGIARELNNRYRLHRIDLPGHGHSEWNAEFARLDDFARAVAPHIPRNATVLGWSLGGLLALRLAALTGDRIARLVLVSTTPRFVGSSDWKPGMAPAVLANFGTRLRDDYRATVQEFLALQVRGEERELASLRELRQRLNAGGLPQPAALEAGLEILRTTDLRTALPHLGQPTLVVAGEHDRVTPPAAGSYLAGQLPDALLHQIQRAGHAPFISHREEFLTTLFAFLESSNLQRQAAGAAS